MLVGLLGTVALAAHGIALQLASISFMVPLGLSNAATVRAGRADRPGRRGGACGRCRGGVCRSGVGWARARRRAVRACCPSFSFGSTSTPTSRCAARSSPPGARSCSWRALFQLADATQVIAVALLRGMRDTRVPMCIAAASYWLVGMPAGWLLGFPARARRVGRLARAGGRARHGGRATARHPVLAAVDAP